MIDRIRGKLASKEPTYVVLDVGGVGYGLHIPVSTYGKLSQRGKEQNLYTYLYVRDDAIRLYGFSTVEERELFEMLLSVSGVGPRMALGILSTLSVNEFREAVSSEDVSLLMSVPGIGRKKGERLLLELKDKVRLFSAEVAGEKEVAGTPQAQLRKDAVSALLSLGCKADEAHKAIKEALRLLHGDVSLEVLIKEALKHL